MDWKQMIQKHSRKILNRISMDLMLEAYLTHESSLMDLDDIPQTIDPVWILGKQYNTTIGKLICYSFISLIIIIFFFLRIILNQELLFSVLNNYYL